MSGLTSRPNGKAISLTFPDPGFEQFTSDNLDEASSRARAFDGQADEVNTSLPDTQRFLDSFERDFEDADSRAGALTYQEESADAAAFDNGAASVDSAVGAIQGAGDNAPGGSGTGPGVGAVQGGGSITVPEPTGTLTATDPQCVGSQSCYTTVSWTTKDASEIDLNWLDGTGAAGVLANLDPSGSQQISFNGAAGPLQVTLTARSNSSKQRVSLAGISVTAKVAVVTTQPGTATGPGATGTGVGTAGAAPGKAGAVGAPATPAGALTPSAGSVTGPAGGFASVTVQWAAQNVDKIILGSFFEAQPETRQQNLPPNGYQVFQVGPLPGTLVVTLYFNAGIAVIQLDQVQIKGLIAPAQTVDTTGTVDGGGGSTKVGDVPLDPLMG